MSAVAKKIHLVKRLPRNFWVVASICGSIAAVFLLLQIKESWRRSTVEPLELHTLDLRMRFGRKAAMDTNLVLIGIDHSEYSNLFEDEELKQNPTLEILKRNFPWSRAVWADLINRLGAAGAKVIAMDLVFGPEGDGDELLQAALDKYKDHVVIGANILDVGTDRGDNLQITFPNPSVLSTNGHQVEGYDDRIGYINIWADEQDGILRSALYRLEGGQPSNFLVPEGKTLESMDARAVRKYGFPEKIAKFTEPMRFRYTSLGGNGWRVHSLADILGPKSWKFNYQNGDFFRGKIVMVGPTADIFQDLHKVPATPGMFQHQSRTITDMLGPEIHLNIINAALHNQFLYDIQPYQNLAIIACAGLIASLISISVRMPFRRIALLMLFCVAYWWLAQRAFDHADLILPVAAPMLVLLLSGIGVLAYDYISEQLERSRTRKTLERYVSRNIVKELLDNPKSNLLSPEGHRAHVTVLFSDVRNFTTMTESADPALLVKQLKEYFTEMVSDVFANDGTLDKFIGDAVMAVWGNVTSRGLEKDAQNAVAAAMAMKRSLDKLNVDWKSRGMPELAFGIGINHGEAICGEMGSGEKVEFTVIGDAVNTASRLEGLTKKFHLDLLLGESAAKLVQERFLLRTVGLIQPKGKTIPAEVYTVIAEKGSETNPKMEAWSALYEEGVKLFRQRNFSEASERFNGCLKTQPDDYLCELYLTECSYFIANPPEDSWNGVFVMTEK